MNLRLFSVLLAAFFLPQWCQAAERSPNFVVIFCDDMGWGDVGCFGNPTIHPEVVERLLSLMKDHEADIESHEDMLAIPLSE